MRKWLALSGHSAAVGLAYAFEPMVTEQLRKAHLKRVLEAYAPTVPGFFLYFPSRSQRSPALPAFVDAARQLASKPTSFLTATAATAPAMWGTAPNPAPGAQATSTLAAICH